MLLPIQILFRESILSTVKWFNSTANIGLLPKIKIIYPSIRMVALQIIQLCPKQGLSFIHGILICLTIGGLRQEAKSSILYRNNVGTQKI
jgi:hypothetical protein